MSKFDCPNCGSGMVESVSSIYSSGSTEYGMKTKIAEMLQPPSYPMDNLLARIFWFPVGLILWMIGSIITYVAFVFHLRSDNNIKESFTELLVDSFSVGYSKAKDRWDNTLYCRKCNLAFDQNTRENANVKNPYEFKKFLFRDTI